MSADPRPLDEDFVRTILRLRNRFETSSIGKILFKKARNDAIKEWNRIALEMAARDEIVPETELISLFVRIVTRYRDHHVRPKDYPAFNHFVNDTIFPANTEEIDERSALIGFASSNEFSHGEVDKLQALPELSQNVWFLKFLRRFSNKDISLKLNISERTVDRIISQLKDIFRHKENHALRLLFSGIISIQQQTDLSFIIFKRILLSANYREIISTTLSRLGHESIVIYAIQIVILNIFLLCKKLYCALFGAVIQIALSFKLALAAVLGGVITLFAILDSPPSCSVERNPIDTSNESIAIGSWGLQGSKTRADNDKDRAKAKQAIELSALGPQTSYNIEMWDFRFSLKFSKPNSVIIENITSEILKQDNCEMSLCTIGPLDVLMGTYRIRNKKNIVINDIIYKKMKYPYRMPRSKLLMTLIQLDVQKDIPKRCDIEGEVNIKYLDEKSVNNVRFYFRGNKGMLETI